MEIKQAIENLEYIKEQYNGAEYSNMHWTDGVDSLDMALEALREKAEREQGCESCRFNNGRDEYEPPCCNCIKLNKWEPKEAR